MNKLSAFEFIHPKLEQFQDTHIYYIKHKSTHQLFLSDRILYMHTIYLLKYDSERDRIVIYHTSSEYCGIEKIEIKKAGSLDNVFELFEWLIPRLTVTLTLA